MIPFILPKPPTTKPHLYRLDGRWYLTTWQHLRAWDMDAVNTWCWMIANPNDPDRPKAAEYLARCVDEMRRPPHVQPVMH